MPITDLLRIPRTYKNLSRAREILAVVVKYGWGDLLDRLQLENSLDLLRHRVLRRREREAIWSYTTEERVRLAFEELGPTFVKFGQVLATRPDLVPMSLIRELRKLQDRVRPFPPHEARQQIELALGKPVSELFESFDDEPLAAASMAQVHRAVLPTGKGRLDVVVKVRRPGLVEVLERDLDILRGLAELIEQNVPESRAYGPRAIVAEFARAVRREADFHNEARNLLRFAANFVDDSRIRVPEVHLDHCSDRTLTLEYIDGVKANDLAGLEAAGIDRRELARVGVDCVLAQIFQHGFFHADPHPGNVFVLPGPVVVLIDMGMMGRLDAEMIDRLLELLVGVMRADAEGIVGIFAKLELVDESADLQRLRRDVAELLDQFHSVPIGRVDVSVMLTQLFEAMSRHALTVPPELLLMAKALATVEGMARELDPELDPLEAMRPQVLRIYVERLADPAFLTRDLRIALDRYLDLISSAPRDLKRVLSELSRGTLTVSARVEELSHRTQEEARSANRKALSLLVAAGLIASSMLLVAGPAGGPDVLGRPLTTLLALVGFGLSGAGLSVLGLGFLRSGRF